MPTTPKTDKRLDMILDSDYRLPGQLGTLQPETSKAPTLDEAAAAIVAMDAMSRMESIVPTLCPFEARFARDIVRHAMKQYSPDGKFIDQKMVWRSWLDLQHLHPANALAVQ